MLLVVHGIILLLYVYANHILVLILVYFSEYVQWYYIFLYLFYRQNVYKEKTKTKFITLSFKKITKNKAVKTKTD